MQRRSYFKAIYWILTAIIGIALVGAIVFTISGPSIDPQFPIELMVFLILTILAVTAIIAAISIFVYKDASKREMDPWMWMTIVVFVPNLIGLIIYLIVRKGNDDNKKKCINCGKPINIDYKVCPYCGADLNLKCPQCGREISSDWQACPYCSSNLK